MTSSYLLKRQLKSNVLSKEDQSEEKLMEIRLQTRTYNTSGASGIFSSVSDQLLLGLGDYGDAVKLIEISVYLRSPTRNPRPTLEGLFDQYHVYLKKLPKITFRRKTNRVEIEFLSQHFDASHNDGWHPSIENAHIAAKEIAEVLHTIKNRIKRDDDFNTDQFLRDTTAILSRKLNSIDELKDIRERAKQKHIEFFAAKSPWERLELDWSLFHPQARDILDDPFYWECADDLAPHGNDTGADLLEDFRRWDKRNHNDSPLIFLDRLYRKWGIKQIDWSIINEDEVQQLNECEPISLRVCNEASIALAFATLKMRASCPKEVLDMATCALKRTAILAQASSLKNEIKSQWELAIQKMMAKLQSI